MLTASFTYDVSWQALVHLHAPPGSIVITHGGELLASFDGSGLQLLVD